MLLKARRVALVAFLISLALMIAGVVIWLFKRSSGTTLQDIMFWMGAFPIALFSIGSMGRFAGRGASFNPFPRSGDNIASDPHSRRDQSDLAAELTSGLNWVLAGLLVWLFSYFM